MNKRHVLLGLVIFASVTTITMVIMSQNMATIQIKAYRFFAGKGRDSGVVSTRNDTPLSIWNSSGNALANITSSAELGRQNTSKVGTKPVTPAPQKPAEPTNRPLQCKNCFMTSFASLLPVPEVCAGSTKPEMLMMITTTLDGSEQRQAIRETWASVTKNNTAHVRHVFLLGTDGGGKVSEEVKKENDRFRDILVSDFVDVYGNLTLKTLAGLHYLVEHCREAKYFLKTDQDMYVFVERVLDLAKKNDKTLQTSLGGSCYQTGKPWRDPKTKYYASIRSYPQTTYPGFCSGTGYIGSMNVARKILETSPDIPFFHLEDVYLALVLRHVGYKLTRYSGFAEGSGVCKAGSRARSAMTIHEVSAKTIREFWAKKCGV